MGVSRPIAGVQPFAELFQGTTTTVYKGYEDSLDRFVLLKVLRPEVSHDDALVRRFEEEARLIARVQHPNIVSIYAFGRDGDATYIIAEFVEGVSLRDLLPEAGLPPEIAAYLLLQVTRGLQAAHERHIFHRDLKPENVLISLEGRVKLTDFGMASLQEDLTEIRGTLGYLAPEQVLGEPFTGTSDLFALGATFFEMLTGRAAFPGTTAKEHFDAIVHLDPGIYLEKRPHIPHALSAICRKLLRKRPAERYENAGALASDIEAFLRTLPTPVTPAVLKSYVERPEAYVLVDMTETTAGMASGDGHTVLPAPGRESLSMGAAAEAERGPVSRPQGNVRKLLQMAAVALAGVVISALVGLGLSGDEETPAPAGSNTPSASTISGEASFQNAGTPLATRLAIDSLLSASERAAGLSVPSTARDGRSQEASGGDAGVGEADARKQAVQVQIHVYPWAEVLINGEARDTTPSLLYLLPGRYILGLRHPSLGTWQTELTVTSGAAKTYRYNLGELLKR